MRHHDTSADHPLAGAVAWLVTEGKAGLDAQVVGVAEALGVDAEVKHVCPKGPWKLMAPLGWLDPAERFGRPGGRFAPPWPKVAIGAGVASIPYLVALKRRVGARVFTVAVQKTAPRNADLVAAPAHDRCHGPNVVTTLTAPHRWSPERLAELRRATPAAIAALDRPRVAVLLGGDNAVYRFTAANRDRLASALASLGRLGASFLVTASRRTPASLMDRVQSTLVDRPTHIWDGAGENPYPAFLAHADLFLVTADSVNMTGEAAASGKPVMVFWPSGGSAKFRRFHAALGAEGVTRPVPERIEALPDWSYAPLDSARVIADEVERRWLARARMLSGMMR